MRVQVCTFKRKERSKTEMGVAVLKHGFGTHDVKEIIDNDGKPLKGTPWTFKLLDGPLAYIDTIYSLFDGDVTKTARSILDASLKKKTKPERMKRR